MDNPSASSPKFLEWSYQSSTPARTLWRWADCSVFNLLGIVLLFITKHACMWLNPLVFALLIDKVVEPDRIPTSRVIISVVILAGAFLANIPFHTWYIRRISKLARELERRLRRALVIRLQQLSIPYHDDSESGRLQAKVLRDVEQVHMIVHQLGDQGLTIALSLIFVTGLTLSRNPMILLVYLVMTPVVIGLRFLFNKRITKENREFRKKIESMNSEVSQMIDMIPVSRAHGVETSATRQVDQKLDQVQYQGQRLDRVNATFQSAAFASFMLGNLGLFSICCWLAFRGVLTVGEVTLYQQLFMQILMAMNQALAIFPQLAKGFESVRSIGEVLECPDLEHNQGKQEVKSVKGEIVYDHLTYTYRGADSPAISDLNLHVPAGECIAVVGPSGGGKSTLIQLTIGFRRPTEGRILLDGLNMEELDMRSWRRFISVVPQESVLFEGSIRDNILFGSPRVEEERFQEIVQAANVREFVDRLPCGFDTRIGENGSRLSGGQRQRLAIARALIRDPKVIVLDEPTSALDVESEKLVQEAIDHMIKGRTTLIVAHRLSTIRNADRILVMQEGRLVEIGSYQELFAKENGAFRKMKDLQG
jgi:ATP-binding cassette subfamily B protein